MKKQLKKNELSQWLRSMVGATILSVSLVGHVGHLKTNITDPLILASALEKPIPFFSEGPYLVEYHSSSAQSGTDQTSSYAHFAMAVTTKAESNNHNGNYLGGYDALMRDLSGFEYLANVGSGLSGPTVSLLILIPQDLNELLRLRLALEEYSIVYAFPDGSGTLNLANLKMGRGLHV